MESRGIALAVSLAVSLAAVSQLTAVPASAAAGPDWPQPRQDIARSALGDSPAILDLAPQWTFDAGAPLAGEPAVLGCDVLVTSAAGEVIDLNAHDGSPVWRSPHVYARPIASAASAIAADGAGHVYAGRPGDPMLAELWRAMRTLRLAIDSYSVDNGEYPPGPDLEPALVPVFIAAMPGNPIALRPMIPSGTPSPGDYRYERTTPSTYALGLWWTDGALAVAGTSGTSGCGIPPAGWPISSEQGGIASLHDPASGAVTWEDLGPDPALDLVPGLAGNDRLWASAETSDRITTIRVRGRLRRTAADGTPVWERRSLAPLRGGAAWDGGQRLFVARGPARVASYIDGSLTTLGVAVESYQVDNGFVPGPGELAPVLVPTYLRCMPLHPLADRAIEHTTTRAPGDYTYEADPARTSYTLTLWDEDGAAAGVFSAGAIVQPAEDQAPAVAAYDPSGGPVWRTAIGDAGNDLSPPLVRPDGSVVVGTKRGEVVALDGAGGAIRWRTPAGAGVSRAPALLPDGAVVVTTDSGDVVALEESGGERWRYPSGVLPGGAPSVSADGIVYAPGADGVLRLVGAGGTLRDQVQLGGPSRAPLSTTAVIAGDWVFVGREDGVLLGLASAATRGRPGDLGNTLFATRQGRDAELSWPGAPAACSFNLRGSGDPASPPDAAIVARLTARTARDAGVFPGPPGVTFYRVYGVECCADLQGP